MQKTDADLRHEYDQVLEFWRWLRYSRCRILDRTVMILSGERSPKAQRQSTATASRF